MDGQPERMSWDSWSTMEHKLGNLVAAEKLVQESFRVRFGAKGAFSVLANKLDDAPAQNQ